MVVFVFGLPLVKEELVVVVVVCSSGNHLFYTSLEAVPQKQSPGSTAQNTSHRCNKLGEDWGNLQAQFHVGMIKTAFSVYIYSLSLKWANVHHFRAARSLGNNRQLHS